MSLLINLSTLEVCRFRSPAPRGREVLSPAGSGGSWDALHRTGKPLGEWLHREFQRKAQRRAAEPRDLRHATGGEDFDRALETGVQPDSTPQFTWLSTASTGGSMGSATVDSTAAGYRKWARDPNIESGLGCGGRSVGPRRYCGGTAVKGR